MNGQGKPTANESIRTRVVNSVARIPSGRVSTYGAIADEHQLSPRQVAQVLATNSDDIPWHRVIKAGGVLPTHDSSWEQRTLLEAEGITVRDGKVQAFKDILFFT